MGNFKWIDHCGDSIKKWCKNTGQLNFIARYIIFVCLQLGNCLMSPFWCIQFLGGGVWIFGKFVYPWHKWWEGNTEMYLKGIVYVRNAFSCHQTVHLHSPMTGFTERHDAVSSSSIKVGNFLKNWVDTNFSIRICVMESVSQLLYLPKYRTRIFS